MILCRNITGRIEVGMQVKPTFSTHKPTTGTAVVASSMPTAATGLRGMSRVDRNHRTTQFLGFDGIVRQIMQLGRIRHIRIPPQLHCLIKGAGELATRLRKDVRLRDRGHEFQSNSPLHSEIVLYNSDFREKTRKHHSTQRDPWTQHLIVIPRCRGEAFARMVCPYAGRAANASPLRWTACASLVVKRCCQGTPQHQRICTKHTMTR